MPLSLAPKLQPLKVVRISADERLKRYLESLGIAAGLEVTVLSQDANGVVLCVKDGRLALDGALARRILVA